jgi:hypothetical protein
MAGFYRHFDQEGRTVELFEQIAAADPEAAAVHWRVVVSQAVDANRLDVLQKYGVDLSDHSIWIETCSPVGIPRVITGSCE